MKAINTVLIEGVTTNELLEIIKDADFEEYLLSNEPIVFEVGTAEVLAKFERKEYELKVNLAHIDGGGEGVLITITNLIKTYCKQNNISCINWHIHARNCVHPNPKLKRILELRKYEVKEIENDEVYFKKEFVTS